MDSSCSVLFCFKKLVPVSLTVVSSFHVYSLPEILLVKPPFFKILWRMRMPVPIHKLFKVDFGDLGATSALFAQPRNNPNPIVSIHKVSAPPQILGLVLTVALFEASRRMTIFLTLSD